MDTNPSDLVFSNISTKRGLMALSPILVFAILYLGVSLSLGDFYAMPLSVAFLASSVWAIIIYRNKPLAERFETFSRAAGAYNIVGMLWIFIMAGAFAKLAAGMGAIDATVNLALRFLPVELLIPGIFLAACFISISIGTSVGTVVALTPLAVEIANTSGVSVAMLVAVVLGGAFFGDNLSFISDTTIAATRSQGVPMNAKFRTNFALVLPAALATLIIYAIIGFGATDFTPSTSANYLLVVPYLVVIVMAVVGINVNIVLAGGILSALLIGWYNGASMTEMAKFMGDGIDSMGDLIVVTLLASGMLGIIKAAGGITWLLNAMTKRVSSARGAKAVIATLVATVNACTANNTVAIITVGSISRDIAEKFGVSRTRSASLLDTVSCIVQCLLPYGAQTLLATGMAGISPAAPWPFLYYPWALSVCVAGVILFKKN